MIAGIPWQFLPSSIALGIWTWLVLHFSGKRWRGKIDDAEADAAKWKRRAKEAGWKG